MQITFLGTGTGLPNRERAPSGLLAQLGQGRLLFDSGSGTVGRLVAAGVEPAELDFLYYTHLHTDHTADLIPLLQVFDLARRDRDLHLTAPFDFWPFLDGQLALQPWTRPTRYEIIRHPAETSPYSPASSPATGPGWTVSAAPTHHSLHSLGYRLESEGKVMAYSGDAKDCAELVELGRDADVLILECSYPDQLAHGDHLCPAQAGQIAVRASAQHLVLTHLYPVCDASEIEAQSRKVFAGRVTVAHDGLVLDV